MYWWLVEKQVVSRIFPGKGIGGVAVGSVEVFFL
jgi:hypothetical protein